MKKNITKKQLDLLKKLNKELDSGAREQLQSLLIQLKDELAAQQRLVDELAFERLVASYEMSESVTQLVEYGASFDSRDSELKLDYHNPNITNANLKASNTLKPFEHGSATREFREYCPNWYTSAQKVIVLMKKDGYRPATAVELLEYYVGQLLAGKIARSEVQGLVALGTVWQGHSVCLSIDPSFRSLDLITFNGVWGKFLEFLAVRETEQA